MDELVDRLIAAAEELHVREIDNPPAYLGTAIAVSDMIRELDEALRSGAPLPKRWAP
jgi:3-dehydroquinate dehydratase